MHSIWIVGKIRSEDLILKEITYVDYSKKYGLGYLVNNKQYGVYFNDETLMSTDSENKTIYFIDNPASRQQQIASYPIDNLPKERDFQKKYLLLERFIVHLNDQAAKLPEDQRDYQKSQKFVYMKQWLKTRHAIMFGMSNKLFQVNFFDNSQILLNTAKKTVLFRNKRNEVTYQPLSNSLLVSDSEMARRIKYTKQILNSIKQKRDKNEDDEGV